MAKERVFQVLVAAILFATFASPARAELIVINANDYTLGTDLSAMFSGLTMAHLSNQPNQDGPFGREAYQPIASAVYAIPTVYAPDVLSFGGWGREILSYESCVSFASDCRHYDVLELRFDSPVDFLQIDSIFYSDYPGLLVYDVFGNQLPRYSGYTQTFTPLPLPSAPTASTITLAREERDISRVVYGGMLGNSTPTRITYNVPEPTTLGLMGLGLFGAAFLKRRQAKTALQKRRSQ